MNLTNFLHKSFKSFLFNKNGPEIYIDDLKSKPILRIFSNNGFVVIKKFFTEKVIKETLNEINNILKLKDNSLTAKYMSDAVNRNPYFLKLILSKNLDFLNSTLLGNDYFFLQTYDIHANTYAHQWHRDISTKTGGAFNFYPDVPNVIKYAAYFESSKSGFFVIPGSHKSETKNSLFGKDMYEISEKINYIKSFNKNEILCILPDPGDLIIFDLRILHCAVNLDNSQKPSKNFKKLRKKVLWPSFARKSFIGESIYQYYRFLRKDFGQMKFDKFIENKLKKRKLLPQNYEKISPEHLEWLRKNLMYPEIYDPILFLNDSHKKVREFRLNYFNKNKIGKYEHIAKLNKELSKLKIN